MGGPSIRTVVRRSSRIAAAAVMLLGGWVGATSHPAHAATTHRMTVGQSLEAVLSHTRPGDIVRLSPGRYGPQRVHDLHLGGVRVVGHAWSDTAVAGIVLDGVTGVSFSNFTVTNRADAGDSAFRLLGRSAYVTVRHLRVLPQVYSGVDVGDRSHDVRILDNVIDGRNVTGAAATDRTARGIRISGVYNYAYDPDYWVRNILVAGNNIRGAGSDDIQVVGGVHVVIRDNIIQRPQKNSDHNDGIQSVGSTYLVITRNRFVAPGSMSPDQAIILSGDPVDPNLRVRHARVLNNLIYDWRGAGIIVVGASHVRLFNNTVEDTAGASVVVVARSSVPTRDVTVVNNVMNRLAVNGVTVTEGRNCVRSGGGGPGDTAAPPRLRWHARYRLRSDSPCRGRATSDAPARDYARHLRDDHPDAGAWEYVR